MEAGADVRFETTVTEILQHPSGRVTGVAARDSHGRPLVASAPLTIGADGAFVGGTVRCCIGGPDGSAGSAFLYGYWDDLPAEGYEWFYAPAQRPA